MSLIFDNIDLTVYNCKVSSSHGKFTTPARDYEEVEIPGRDGTLLISNDRVSNYTVSFDCYINYNFLPNYEGLIKMLLDRVGYKKLKDTADGWEAQACFLGNVEPEMTPQNKGGKFTLMFTCKPDRYLYSAG